MSTPSTPAAFAVGDELRESHALDRDSRSPSARPASLSLSRRNSLDDREHVAAADVPCFSARSDERWITGPSAIGSENGMPSSITSAPPFTSACMIGTVCAASGSPAVTNGISAARRDAARRSKTCGDAVQSCDPRRLAPRCACPCRRGPRGSRGGSCPCAIVGAIFIACATAWLDSSAGMMPSRRHSWWKACERLVVGDRHVLARGPCP